MLADWLVRKFIARADEVSDPQVRRAYGSLEGWTSVAINLVVFAAKLVPGILIGSVSLIADAFHSLSDVLSSAVVIWGFHVAAKPSDREHPFGHGRLESIAALVMSLMLLLTAWEFGRASVDRLLHPKDVQAGATLLVVLAVTAVIKEWLSRFSRDLGKRIGSSALMADFWHHRSDVLATGVVILALIGGNFGLAWVDGVAGLVVSLFIAWSAWEPLRSSIDPLIGEAPAPQVLHEMREAALSVPGVMEVHDLVVHRYGELAVTSLHIEVDAGLDITQGHELAERVEQKLNQRLAGSSVVHVDPVDRNHPLYQPVNEFLRATVPTLPGASDFHDLRIVGRRDEAYVIFDMHVETDEAQPLVERLNDVVRARFPEVSRVIVNLEPKYVF